MTIEINHEFWDIVFVMPNDPVLHTSMGDFSIGVCDDNLKCIFINCILDEQKMKKVLCHEITHAAMFSYNIDLSIEQEELVADLMATFGQEIISQTHYVFYELTK